MLCSPSTTNRTSAIFWAKVQGFEVQEHQLRDTRPSSWRRLQSAGWSKKTGTEPQTGLATGAKIDWCCRNSLGALGIPWRSTFFPGHLPWYQSQAGHMCAQWRYTRIRSMQARGRPGVGALTQSCTIRDHQKFRRHYENVLSRVWQYIEYRLFDGDLDHTTRTNLDQDASVLDDWLEDQEEQLKRHREGLKNFRETILELWERIPEIAQRILDV